MSYVHYNMKRELHVNMPVMWCHTWLAHLCIFVDVVSTCDDCMNYVVRDMMWMQMPVEKLNCEELVGKLYGSFYEKHLEVLLLNKSNVLVWLSLNLKWLVMSFGFDDLNQFGLFYYCLILVSGHRKTLWSFLFNRWYQSFIFW